MRRRELLIGAAALLASGPAMAAEQPFRRAAREAFLYALPLVEIANVRAGASDRGMKPGRFLRQGLATPESRGVTKPNNDTLNAQAFIDLARGPARLRLPPLGGRYASLALMDMFSNDFAVLGTRTTGDVGREVLLVGPNDKGRPGALRAPTPWVWAVARVLVDGPKDLGKAREVLDGFRVVAAPARPPAAGAAFTAPWADYLKAANALLLENPPLAADHDILQRMAPLGLGSDRFDPGRFDPAAASQIAAGVDEARALLLTPRRSANAATGWGIEPDDVGNFGQDYETRARVAHGGLGALPPPEAMSMSALSPDGGRRFDGDGPWRLSFAGGQTPPVNAAWSLTLYEATPDGQFFLTANPINRYSIGDRTPGLIRGRNGLLDIWISRTDPGGARSANWLPAPAKGPFAMVLRAYQPKPALLSHAYVPPPVIRI
ncbi:MAG TPA: DUF1254 domain-containing protein [Caulobacteraceae bacterium]|jgi:hypothetical protein|nr:DUF1254 domain-containing protein [Caulobacteraceae bacterium]